MPEEIADQLSAEDAKLVTLARAARARINAIEGAAVRDGDGDVFVAHARQLDADVKSLFVLGNVEARRDPRGAPGFRKKRGREASAPRVGEQPIDRSMQRVHLALKRADGAIVIESAQGPPAPGDEIADCHGDLLLGLWFGG